MSNGNKEKGKVSLVTLESDVLTMTLVRDTSPQASLFLKNTLTTQSVLFKVKSTMPSRFYVQPSMRVIDPGCTEEVSIVLVVAECNRFIAMKDAGNRETADRHRFLVQSIIVREEDCGGKSSQTTSSSSSLEITDKPSDKANDLIHLWESTADTAGLSSSNVSSSKVKVEFIYPEAEYFSGSEVNVQTVSETVDTIRKNILDYSKEKESVPASDASLKHSPVEITTELGDLRKKYEDVVAYTVQLTVERDSLLRWYESNKKEKIEEVLKEKTKTDERKNPSLTDDIHQIINQHDTNENGGSHPGHSLFSLLLSMLATFVIGRYLREILTFCGDVGIRQNDSSDP